MMLLLFSPAHEFVHKGKEYFCPIQGIAINENGTIFVTEGADKDFNGRLHIIAP